MFAMNVALVSIILGALNVSVILVILEMAAYVKVIASQLLLLFIQMAIMFGNKR